MLLKLLELRFWWPYSLFTTEDYCHFTSEAPTLVRASATQDVDALLSHGPSSSDPQNSGPHMLKCPVISAEDMGNVASSACNAIAQAHSGTPTGHNTAIAAPQDRLTSSRAPQISSQARVPPVALIDFAHTNQVFFHGAQHFEVGNFVHAPNAAQVHIANESNQHNTVRIEFGRMGEIANYATQIPTRDFINAPNATQINVVHQGVLLDTLPKHPEMSSKLAEYLPDSRQPEVKELCGRESSGTDLVLCIHGPAGIGKTTLAGHLCDGFRSAGRLAASIFLGAVPTTTLGPEAIIKMAAREIGSNHSRAIPKVVEAINGCHGSSLETHLQKYIVEPLRSLQHPQPFIIIIDAMDEWPDHPLFLKSLASLNAQSDIVKFILTDRLNPRAFHLPGAENVAIDTFSLGPIRKEVIRAFFYKHLESVPWEDCRKATPADVEKLTELSEGLPVWAATVVALLSFRFCESPPHKILEEILGSRRQVGGSQGLEELYRKALARLFPNPEDRVWLRRFLGAIISLQEPLCVSDFETLTGIPSHLTKRIRFSLSAVQTRSPPPGSETMVHPAAAMFHLSLLEYIQATTTEACFSVSTFDSHSVLGLACIEQILSLPSSASLVPHLRAHQLYAVKYWQVHVSKGTPRLKAQWVETKHWQTLQKIPLETLRRWASLFAERVLRRNVDLTTSSQGQRDDILSLLGCLYHALEASGGDCWGFQVAGMEVAVRVDDGYDKAWMRLGRCYYARGERTSSLQMYEEAVAAFRRALDLRSGLHPHRASTLHDVAVALYSCYDQNGSIDLIKEAISLLREGLGLCPPPHPLRHVLLNNLAGTLQSLYQRDNDVAKLNEASSLHCEALALRPAPHPDRAGSLNNLAGTLQSLYQRDGDVAKLTEASSLHREALALCPAPHPDRAWFLSNLANTLKSLYQRDGDVAKLTEASSLHREALALCPAPHPDRAWSLSNLANALQSLYRRDGDVAKLTEASSLHRESLALRPAPHPDRALSLNNLANALQSLYQCNGDIAKLNKASSLHREALALCPAPHPHRASSLNNLANTLQSLYERDGNIAKLNEASSLHREALALYPAPHPHRASSLNNLASTLRSLYERDGDIAKLNEASSLHREGLALRPAPHPRRALSLTNLANTLESLYPHNGDVTKLTEASSLHREALALRPAPHPHRFLSLNNLANTLKSLYERDGDIAKLNEASSLHREALALRPAPHPHRALSLNNLANTLKSLYERDGDIAKLNEASSLHREALALRPAPHPNRASSLNNLGLTLRSLYERDGEVAKLNEASSLHREGLALCPAPHPNRAVSLNNLGRTLQSLYEHDGNISSLNKAESLCREALTLHPAPHADRHLSLNNLVTSLLTLYQHNGSVGLLDEAISLCHQTLALCPVPHPGRYESLKHLANALASQFAKDGSLDVLDEAISFGREALVFYQPGHIHRTGVVNDLARHLNRRREATGDDRHREEINDLEEELAGLRGKE